MVTPMSNPEFVYKIVTAQAYAQDTRDGVFAGMPIDKTDGYSHLSTAAQLAETLSLYFKGQSDLLILAVCSYDLGTALRWEPSRGGQLFPHYYGLLPVSAIAWTALVSVGANGEVDLPDAVI
jgi:uncharacterized protein (DUF952 family)